MNSLGLLKKRKRREDSANPEEGKNGHDAHGLDEKDINGLSSLDHMRPELMDDDDESYEGALKLTKFIMKNGCCRECMKAFSKTGKSCLCQVPRLQRRATLPTQGCKYCGCKGCNPIDIRRDKR